MTEYLNGKPSTNFWIISGAALVWNLIGLAFFYGHITITPEQQSQLTDEMRNFLLNTPVWADAAFGVAVIGGVIGSVLLLLRKAWAVPVLAISLLGVIAQNTDAFLMRDVYAIGGVDTIIVPVPVFIVAVALLLYSRATKARGWLS